MEPETTDLHEYLVSDDLVDWKTPSVRDKAIKLIGDIQDEVTKAECLFEWVRDKIPHSADINSDVVTCSASEVMQEGTGICYAKSHLLAALLRATGIPSGFCYQVLKRDPPHQGFALHGLNGVYLTSQDKWILLDPRGNTGLINAQFSIQDNGLAFFPDPGQGEFIYETIYAHPAPVVIDVLRLFSNRSEMWPHLPMALAK